MRFVAIGPQPSSCSTTKSMKPGLTAMDPGAGPLYAASRSTFTVGAAHSLFALHTRAGAYVGFYPGSAYDVAPDGQHFLLNSLPGATGAPTPITSAVNWTSALTRP